MDDSAAQKCVKDRAWATVVRLAAGILKRDHGKDAIEHAQRRLWDAQLEQHDQSIRLWKAVIDEIERGGDSEGR